MPAAHPPQFQRQALDLVAQQWSGGRGFPMLDGFKLDDFPAVFLGYRAEPVEHYGTNCPDPRQVRTQTENN